LLSVRLGPQPRFGCALNGAGEIFRRLRTGNNHAAAQDEAGHAIDAGFLGAIGFALDAVDIVVAGEKPARPVAVHAAIDRGLDQYFGVAQIGPVGEVEFHQPLLDQAGIGEAARPQNETMAVERVWLAADLVRIIDEAFQGGGGRDAFGNRRVALDRAKFGFKISAPVDAFAAMSARPAK
jgi:hypothetical protein